LSEDNTELLLQFMSKDDMGYYYWPTADDIGWEPLSSIKHGVDDPIFVPEKSNRRRQTFKIKF